MRKFTSPLNNEFNELVEKKLGEWQVPGCSVAVVQGDQVDAAGYGIAQFPSTKVEPSTLFYTGSTTKAFLAATWASVIDSADNQKKKEEDRITFSTPLASLIRDDFVLSDDYVTNHVTIEDALSHRTGLAGHDMTYGGPINNPKKVTRSLRHLPLSHEFRTTYDYCNIMYVAATHALQTVTGEWVGKTMHDKIWKPLGMSTTFFQLSDAQKCEQDGKAKLAMGYRWVKGGPDDTNNGSFQPEEYMVMPETDGAGGIISNVLDYAKWLRMLFSRSAPLSAAMHDQLILPRIIEAATEKPFDGTITYALGWSIQDYKGHRVASHNGGLIGFGSHVIYLPDKDWGVVMMANTRGTSNALLQALTMHLLDNRLAVPTLERFDFEARSRKRIEEAKKRALTALPTLYPRIHSPPLPPTLPLASYAGIYSHPAYRTLTFTLQRYTPPGTALTRDVLFADGRADRTWRISIRLEHISAEFWIAYILCPEEVPVVAEFRLGPEGTVAEFGMAASMEGGGGGRKTWFRRDDGDAEGA